jgi:hypothetical protein
MASPMPALPYNAACAPTIARRAAGRARSRLAMRAGGLRRTVATWTQRPSRAWQLESPTAAFGSRPDSAMHERTTVGAAPLSASISHSERVRRRRSRARNGERMLPDFRFVLGAILAIALLAVAGLGLVSSVQLVREAHMGPLGDARSLAFVGHAERNQFYDPDSARRFAGLPGTAETPVAPARLETPAEIATVAPPAATEERTAGIAPNRADADIADDKTAVTSPPRPAETPEAVTIPAPSAEAAAALAPDVPATTPLDPPSAERFASAPATSSAADLRVEPQAPTATPTEPAAPMQPQASRDPKQGSLPPLPTARPKVRFRKKIARAHFRPVDVASQQASPNMGFLSMSTPWPGSNNPITDAATTKKVAGKLGTLANRPQ